MKSSSAEGGLPPITAITGKGLLRDAAAIRSPVEFLVTKGAAMGCTSLGFARMDGEQTLRLEGKTCFT
jgi:hypothetical protein